MPPTMPESWVTVYRPIERRTHVVQVGIVWSYEISDVVINSLVDPELLHYEIGESFVEEIDKLWEQLHGSIETFYAR